MLTRNLFLRQILYVFFLFHIQIFIYSYLYTFILCLNQLFSNLTKTYAFHTILSHCHNFMISWQHCQCLNKCFQFFFTYFFFFEIVYTHLILFILCFIFSLSLSWLWCSYRCIINYCRAV